MKKDKLFTVVNGGILGSVVNPKKLDEEFDVVSTLTGSKINKLKLGLSIGGLVLSCIGIASTFFKAGANGGQHGQDRALYLAGLLDGWTPEELKKMKVDKV